MGYLEMKFEEAAKDIVCIGISYEDFLTDLMFTTKELNYPQMCFHEKMQDLMVDMAYTKTPLPLMFTVEIDGDMTVLGFRFRYTFSVMTKKAFQKAYREYGIADEIMDKCLAPNTDAVVVYCGMNICG